MLDLGTVRPGSTIYVPFHTFDSNDPSASVTITGLATTDIEIYKDGSVTQRASDAGYTLLDTDGIDFDTTTGIHGISIDLGDNTTAGFYAAGSQYWVVIASITVDAATVNFIAATFRIGYPDAIVNTTIATLASQTSFTLTAGSADDDAYNGCPVVVHDVASGVQVAQGVISDYVGSTKTVTLRADPGIFTMAATDNISVFLRPPLSEVALGNAEDFFDGTGYAGTGNTIPTVTNVTNLHASAATAANQTTILNRLGSFTATGVNTVLGFFQALMRSDATTPSDLGGTYDDATDSLQAIRDHVGDGTNLSEAGGTGDHLTAIPWNASWDTEVQSEVDDALVARGLDHLVNAAVVGTDVADNSIVARLVSSSATADWDTYVNTTDSMQAVRDHIGDGTNLTEAGGNGDHLTEAGGTGDHLTAVPWNAAWDAEVESEVNDGLVAIGLDHLVSASVTGTDVTDGSIVAELVSSAATPDWDTYDNTSDSLQAIRDRGDVAWITGGGGGITDILNVQAVIPTSIDLADTVTVRLGLMLTNALDDLPSTAEITPGTIDIDRKAIGGTSWSSVLAAAACSEQAGMIYYDEVFDSGSGYAEGDSIRVTFKSQKITVSANDYEITDANGVAWQTEIRQTMRGTDSANTTTPPTAAAIADAVLDEALAGHSTAGTLGKAVTDIEIDTTEIGTAGAGLSAVPWNAAWDAEVESEVSDALVATGLDHLVSASVTGTDITDGSIVASLVSSSATPDWDTYDNTSDSLQSIRDRGDAAWTTGGGGSITDILHVTPLVPQSIDLGNTATWRLGLMLTNAVDDLPSTAEITPGTISIDRKAIGDTSWSAIVTDAACSELAGMVYYDEVFDSGTGYGEGDSIRVTFKSQKITVAANDYEISDANGRVFYTSIRQTMRGTDSANTTTPPTAAAIADQVWDEVRSGHTTAGTYGEFTGDAAMRGTDSANTTTPPTAAAIADQVWDEARAGHTTAGTFGEFTGDAAMRGTDSANTTTPPTAAAIADAVLDEALAGHATAGTLGKAVTDIEADTNELQTDWANGGRLDLLLDSAQGTTQITESYAANGVAPTRDQALMAVHQMLMQFAISGTSITVKELDNTTTAFVVTLDDATTPTSAART